MKALGNGDVLHGLGRSQRGLHFRNGGPHGAPFVAGWIERQFAGNKCKILVVLGWHPDRRVIVPGACQRRFLKSGPANSALEQVLETGMSPGACIVAPGCIKYAAFAVRAGPGPGLFRAALGTGLQYNPILRVVFGVYVSLVPAVKSAESRH